MNNEQLEEALKAMKFTKTTEYRTIYANWVQAAFGPFDISMLLGTAFAHPTQEMIVEQAARVVFSPIEAKLTAMILTNVIKSFENQFGEIKIPEGLDSSLTITGAVKP
jgi:hypothetical protein